jgi:hypothetical protein
MFVDVIRSPRIIKPQLGIGLNWTSPLLDGLITLLAMQEGGGGLTSAIPIGFTGSFQGTTPPIWTPNHDIGPALKFSGAASASASYLDYGTPPTVQDIAKGVPCSWAFRVGYSGVTQGGWLQKNGGSTTSNSGWVIGAQNNVGLIINFGTVNLNFKLFTTGTPYTGGAFQTVVITWDGKNTASSAHIYVDGRDFSATATTGTGTQTSDSANHLQVGRADQGASINGGFQGEMAWVAMWNRVLTPAEVQDLSLNPNILFEFTARRLGLLAGVPPNLVQPFNWVIT